MLRPGLCSKFAIAVHRFRYKIDQIGKKYFIFTRLLRAVFSLGCYLAVVFCKIIIKEDAKLDPFLWLSPRGNIILGVQHLGCGCVIHHNVTLGMGLGSLGRGVVPHLGNNVWIGPDSIIHGDIVIGDGVTILPGSVLAKSIRSGCVVAGNPARIVKYDFNNEKLRLSTRYNINIGTINTEEQSHV